MSVLSNFPSNNVDKHASQHAANGSDPISLADIGVSNPWINDNGVFLPSCLVDQRQGYVVPPGIVAYKDKALSILTGGVTDTYYKIVEKTSTYGRFVGNDSLDYYVAASDCVRGYADAGYCVDRWISASNSITVLIEDDGLRIIFNASGMFFYQPIPLEIIKECAGHTLIYSALCGEISGKVSISEYPWFVENHADVTLKPNAVTSWRIVPKSDATVGGLTFWGSAGSSFKLKAAKLELGDTQTLAHQDADGKWVLNELPNYADTLARCQRYQRKIFISRLNASSVSTQMIQFCLNDVLTGMRATPSLTLFGKQMDTLSSVTGGLMGVIPGGNGDEGWSISAGTTYSMLVRNNSILIKANIPKSKFTVTSNSGLNYILTCGEGVYIFADANL